MPPKEWTSQDLRSLAGAYWSTASLFAAVRTGITAHLVRGPAAADQLARELDLDPRATGMLLTALLALKLATKKGKEYSLAPGLAPLLDPEGPHTLVYNVLHFSDMMGDWARLDESIRSGGPVKQPEGQANQSQSRDNFYRAMRDLARAQAPGTAARLGLKAGQRLLDLGGGPGVWGLTFASEVPGLSVTVFDLPRAEKHFQEERKRHPRGGEVRFLPGDYAEARLGGPYDVIWLSQVLHGEGPEAGRMLVATAASALTPGGVLWVQEFILDRDNPDPPWPALFNLNMLVNTPRGQSYSAGEIMEFMTSAGLTRTEHVGAREPGWPAGLVRGFKPA